MPAREYDELFVEAQRARVTVPEVIRRRLRARAPGAPVDAGNDEQ